MIVNTPMLLPEQHKRTQTHFLLWAGYAVFIWSIAYMLPHLYWAMGGTVGMSILKSSVAELPEFQLINWVASVILTAAGFLGLAFVHLKKRRVRTWFLLTISLIGCAISTSHGIYGIIYRILQMAGVIELESGTFNLNEHTYVLWDLILFEPWFTIEGLLLGVVGWCYLTKRRDKRIWLILCILAVITGLVTGLLGVRFA